MMTQGQTGRPWPGLSPQAGASWLIFAVLLSVYLLTLLPGVGGYGDTAKFQFVGKVLGIPHATGYPSYLLINHFFLWLIPFGSLAWQANLLAAILAAAAGVVLFRFLLGLGVHAWAAGAAALLLGWNRTLWDAALVAEVYTLHLLLMILVLFGLLRWRRSGADRDLLGALLVYAIALGNHLTSVMLLPAMLWFILVSDGRALIRPRILLGAGLCILLAVAQYGYLFWRTADPSTPYVENPVSNLNELWALVTGQNYHRAMFVFSPQQFVTRVLPAFGSLLLRELHLALPLALWGMLRIRRIQDRAIAGALLIYLAFNTLWALNYNIHDIRVYFIPSYLVIVIFAAIGLDDLATRLRAWKGRWWPAVLLVLPALFLLLNWQGVDKSDHRETDRSVQAILEQIGRRAVIISPNYSWSEYFWYYLIGEGHGQRDLFVMHHFSADTVAAYLEDDRLFALPEQRRRIPAGLAVYCLDPRQAGELQGLGLRLQDVGQVIRVRRGDTAGHNADHTAGQSAGDTAGD